MSSLCLPPLLLSSPHPLHPCLPLPSSCPPPPLQSFACVCPIVLAGPVPSGALPPPEQPVGTATTAGVDTTADTEATPVDTTADGAAGADNGAAGNGAAGDGGDGTTNGADAASAMP